MRFSHFGEALPAIQKTPWHRIWHIPYSHRNWGSICWAVGGKSGALLDFHERNQTSLTSLRDKDRFVVPPSSSSNPFGAVSLSLSLSLSLCVCVCVCVCVKPVALYHRTHRGRGRSVGRERNSNGGSGRQQCAGYRWERSYSKDVPQHCIFFFFNWMKFFLLRPGPPNTSTFRAFDSFAARASVEDVQKTRIQAGVPGFPSLCGQHDPSPLFLPGVCRMKKAWVKVPSRAQRWRCLCWRSASCSAPWRWSPTGCRRPSPL